MILKRIELRRMPGMDEPFTVAELREGINLVLGPNGSGKSSLCRAIRATLWPERKIDGPAEVETTWRRGGVDYHAALAGAVRWQKEGAAGEPPTLPDAGLADCYTIGLTDLFNPEGKTDTALASDVRIEMAGGYDLEELIARFTAGKRAGNAERKAYDAARRRLRKAEGQQRELADREDGIAELERELEICRRAGTEMEQLRSALELAALREKRSELEARLELFPPQMEELRGDEGERLAGLEEELRAAEEELGEAEKRRGEAEERLKRESLPGGAVEETALGGWKRRLRELEQLENRLEEAEKERAAAGGELDRAAADLGGAVDPARLEADAPGLLERADRWIARAARLREERQKQEARLAALRKADEGEAETPGRSASYSPDRDEEIATALAMLHEWLSSPPPERPRFAHPAILAFLGIAAAAGAAASYLVHPYFAALAGAAAGALLVVLLLAARPAARKRRGEIERRYLASGFPPPDGWEDEAIRRRIGAFHQEQIARERTRQRQMEREAIEAELELLGGEEEEVARDRAALRGESGIDEPFVPDLRLDDLARSVAAWRRAGRELAAVDEGLGKGRKEQDERFDALRAFIEENLGRAPADVADAFEFLEELERRSGAIRRAEEDQERADGVVPGIRARIGGRRKAIGELLERLGLDPGETRAAARALANRLGQLEGYRAEREARDKVNAQMSGIGARLAERADLLTSDREDLGSRLAGAEEQAERYDDRHGRIVEIGTEIRQAKESTGLEEAIAAEERSRAALAEKGEEILEDAACRFLLEKVRREYERDAQPAVLRRASRLLARFTRRKYELGVDAEGRGGAFYALESESGRGVPLAELSDATRAQLLLAARLAFAAGGEGEHRPPLFLDEALSTSDPDRFRAVAKNVIDLAVEGRQIFYMTSNPADVGYWKEIAAEAGVEVHVVDLAEVRNLARGAPPPAAFALPDAAPPPPPGDASPEEYAATLGVALPDPFAPVEAVHLFHLLRDRLELLHRLLEAQIETIGQWATLNRQGDAGAFASDDERDLIETRRELFDAYLKAWRIGRNRPFRREVLAESGAVSDTWLEKLASLLAQFGGDGDALLRELRAKDDPRAKGFLSSKADELEEYLQERGYIDERTPLGDGEIRARVLAVASPRIGGGTLATDEVNRLVDQWRAALRTGADQPA